MTNNIRSFGMPGRRSQLTSKPARATGGSTGNRIPRLSSKAITEDSGSFFNPTPFPAAGYGPVASLGEQQMSPGIPGYSSAFVYNSVLYTVFPCYVRPLIPHVQANSSPILVTSFDLSGLNEAGTLPVPSSGALCPAPWQLSPNPSYPCVSSQAGLSSCIAGGNPFIFWQDTKGSMAMQMQEGSGSGSSPSLTAASWAKLLDISGNQLWSFPQNDPVDISAVSIDDQTILVATIQASGLFVGRYNPADIQTSAGATDPGTWKAAQQWTFSLAQLQAACPGLRGLGANLSTEWYSFTADSSFFVASLWDSSANIGYLFYIPLDLVSMPLMFLGDLPGGGAAAITGFNTPSVAPVALKKDPAGRLRMYWLAPGGRLIIATQPSNSAEPGELAAFSVDYQPQSSAVWAPSSVPCLSVAFTPSPNSVPTTVVNDPDGLESEPDAFPVAENIFCLNGGNSGLSFLSGPLGRLQPVTGLSGELTSQSQRAVVFGITEGPLPIPNENTRHYQFAGGYPADAGDFVYGLNNVQDNTRTFTQAYTRGIMSEEESAKGVGPAWDISFSGGVTLGQGSSDATQTLQSFTQQSMTEQGTQLVKPTGTLFSRGVVMTTNLYRFLEPLSDSSGDYEVANDACRYAEIACSFQGENDLTDYAPSMITPGDITSYTRPAWNKAMSALGYPRPTYFEDVVLPNAYVFDGGCNYIEFDWTQDSQSSTGYGHTTTSYSEFGWTFDASIYAGVSWGEGVEIFGFGEGTQGKFMAGFTVALAGNSQTAQEQDWHMGIQSFACPPPTPGFAGYLSYTFRVYFLPSSQQNLDELLQYSNDPTLRNIVDPNSRPWRVLSEVVAYTRVEADGKTVTSYPPSGTDISAAAPTVPAADNASQWTAASGAPTSWVPGASVSYMVVYVNGAVTAAEGSWSAPVQVGAYSCPQLAIPVDSTGFAASRRVFRRFGNGTPQLVLTVGDNSSTTCIDNSPAFNLIPPSTAPAIPSPLDAGQWNARSNYPGSNVWTPGNQVSYAVSYLYKNAQSAGETAIGPWSPWATVGAFAYPILSQIPLPAPLPAGSPFEYVGRRIYRQAQVPGGSGNSIIQSQTLVFELDDTQGGSLPTTASDPPLPYTFSATQESSAAMVARSGN